MMSCPQSEDGQAGENRRHRVTGPRRCQQGHVWERHGKYVGGGRWIYDYKAFVWTEGLRTEMMKKAISKEGSPRRERTGLRHTRPRASARCTTTEGPFNNQDPNRPVDHRNLARDGFSQCLCLPS